MLSKSPPVLNASETEVLRKAFLRLIVKTDAFAAATYEGLFTRVPTARDLFPQNMDEQNDKFVQMIARLLDALDDPDGGLDGGFAGGCVDVGGGVWGLGGDVCCDGGGVCGFGGGVVWVGGGVVCGDNASHSTSREHVSML